MSSCGQGASGNCVIFLVLSKLYFGWKEYKHSLGEIYCKRKRVWRAHLGVIWKGYIGDSLTDRIACVVMFTVTKGGLQDELPRWVGSRKYI